jgi:hypothetical protein
MKSIKCFSLEAVSEWISRKRVDQTYLIKSDLFK